MIILFSSMNSLAQDSDYLEAFLKKWKNSKEYLLEIARAMPENQYDFQPTPRQMSFSAQLQHINRNMTWIHSDYILKDNNSIQKEFPDQKAEIINKLNQSFNTITESVKALNEEDLKEKSDFFSGEMSTLQLLNLMQDHVTHHRGQLIVYLNLNNIEPPAYRGW